MCLAAEADAELVAQNSSSHHHTTAGANAAPVQQQPAQRSLGCVEAGLSGSVAVSPPALDLSTGNPPAPSRICSVLLLSCLDPIYQAVRPLAAGRVAGFA